MREGYRTLLAEDGQQALELCRKHRVDVVLTDLMLPGMGGIDLLKALKTIAPDAEVVVMTAYGTVEKAVEAMREGAYDFVEKPLKRLQIVKTVRKAAERHALLAENRTLRKELSALRNRAIVGSSPALRQVLEVATQAAPSTATVLVLGQSGTGKELLARHIHEHSGREGPFVGVNLAALPETIVESELFGHEKGAFTGAVARRAGRIAQAERGTLFLDEIGELSVAVQVKLLRVLQEGEYEPLGGSTQRANFRLIAATNRDLKAEVEAGRFREDLFYRLNVIAITCPTLSQRRDDIPLLVDHFLQVVLQQEQQAADERDARRDGSPDGLRVAGQRARARERDRARGRAQQGHRASGPRTCRGRSRRPKPTGRELSFPVGTPLEEIERRVIHATLTHTAGDKRLAAQLLGIATRTIYRKLAAEEG